MKEGELRRGKTTELGGGKTILKGDMEFCFDCLAELITPKDDNLVQRTTAKCDIFITN